MIHIIDAVKQTIHGLDVTTISSNRKTVLQPLIDYIKQCSDTNELAALNFICTHNSRRSHLSQIWAQTMAYHVGLFNVTTFSGGTAATALFPVVAATLKQQGFAIEELTTGTNPIYSVNATVNAQPIIGFSKVYDHAFNPASKFAAILTCSQADADCPFIPGAAARIPIPYIDPKRSDNTPQQAQTYLETSQLIATEMLYVFTEVLS